MDNKSSTSSRSPGDVEGEPVAKKSSLVSKTIVYDESVANQWLDEPHIYIVPCPLQINGRGSLI